MIKPYSNFGVQIVPLPFGPFTVFLDKINMIQYINISRHLLTMISNWVQKSNIDHHILTITVGNRKSKLANLHSCLKLCIKIINRSCKHYFFHKHNIKSWIVLKSHGLGLTCTVIMVSSGYTSTFVDFTHQEMLANFAWHCFESVHDVDVSLQQNSDRKEDYSTGKKVAWL